MISVIVAGGSGTRLWPLSTPSYPKHLLKINGSQKSLLQSTYERAGKISSSVYVMTDKSHAHHVEQQLPELDKKFIMVEPGRRGTASCIISALAELSNGGVSENEPIAFLHADHYIRDIEGFAHSFKVASKVSAENSKITLVGVEPDNPATIYGYIQKGDLVDEADFVFSVESFKEKPEYETAKQYLKSGDYLWNCGYFVGSLKTFEYAIGQYAPGLEDSYQKLKTAGNKEEFEKVYLELETKVIDIALIEKVPDLLVVPASFDWMDVGSYGDMHKAVDSDKSGNHVHGSKVHIERVENSFVQNHEEKPLAVVGLDNVVVINTPSGILVARKDLSKDIGEVAKKIGE